MKKVVLYTRVSTDDQRENGYSLQDQKARLIKECEKKGYEILHIYSEDHSAKTFNRPEWKKFTEAIKQKKIAPDIFLCTKPDRFSRIAIDGMLQRRWLLQKNILLEFLDIEIDYDSPNAVLSEAIAFAMPEADNENRSKNVKSGMRQARKEGRYPNRAPIGYSNQEKRIVPNQDAEFVIRAFNEISKEIYPADVVRQRLITEGFKGCQRNNFYKIIRNPVYCGLIRVPASKNDPGELVKGSHEPLITEELFYEVQDILEGRKRKSKKCSKANQALPLRGLLCCAICGHIMTGSISKNKIGKPYTYNHCQKGCSRVSQIIVDEEILSTLNKMVLPEEVVTLYLKVVEDVLKDDDSEVKLKIRQLEKDKSTDETRVHRIEDQLADGNIDSITFNTMKKRYNDSINKAVRKITELNLITTSFKKYMNFAVCLVKDLPAFYLKADNESKYKLVCSIFPEKIYFEKKKYRTPKINPVIEAILLKDTGLDKKKGGLHKMQSPFVARRGIEPLFPE